jgi:hypothetical protein
LHLHYEILGKTKFVILERNLGEYKVKNFECNLQRLQNIFTVATKTNEAADQARFIISQKDANKSKPSTDVDYITECIMKAAETLCGGK